MLNYHKTPSQTTLHTKYYKSNFTTNNVLNKAQGQWPQILESLGINPSHLKNKHGPCPVCGGKDRFRFDDKQKGMFFCNQCRAGNGIKLLQLFHRWSFQEAIDRVAEILGMQTREYSLLLPAPVSTQLYKTAQFTAPQKIRNRIKLSSMWRGSKSVTVNDPVHLYLKARGLHLERAPSVLRFHSNLPYYDENGIRIGTYHAMVALVQNQRQCAVTLHRTYLDNGRKANLRYPKKLMPPITPGAFIGGAIRLYEPVDGKLALAEGIETALAFRLATHLPVWSTINAFGMESIILPEHVTTVVIAVDNDESQTGQKAAATLTKRLLSEGRTVKRVMPPIAGKDFADMLIEDEL